MKNYFSFFILLIAFTRMNAQETTDFPYNAGGFGHFYTGPSFYQVGELRGYLESASVLNTTIPKRAGTIAGGEGFALLGRFLIGGGGFGEGVQRHTTDSARLDISFGGGYFKFGYVFCYKNYNFCYAYSGIGWGGLNVHLENLSNENSIVFNRRVPLGPGFKRDYSLAFNFYEFGVSGKHLFVSTDQEGDGGFMLGLDLGCNIMLPTGDWLADEDEVVSGPPVPRASLNPYLRLTIGGGGFNFK